MVRLLLCSNVFGADFTDFTVFVMGQLCKLILDRIYRIFRILFCLSTFLKESLKIKSLCEKERSAVMGDALGDTVSGRGRIFDAFFD